jgi:peptidoglycan/LPS O-acetylase OafA/YrhL
VSAVLLLVGTAGTVVGGALLFVAARARHRLLGLAVMSLGAVLALLSVVPGDRAALPAALAALVTLAALLLVARHLERAGHRPGVGDLDLDEDPAR